MMKINEHCVHSIEELNLSLEVAMKVADRCSTISLLFFFVLTTNTGGVAGFKTIVASKSGYNMLQIVLATKLEYDTNT